VENLESPLIPDIYSAKVEQLPDIGSAVQHDEIIRRGDYVFSESTD
jgi:hypothetical protein